MDDDLSTIEGCSAALDRLITSQENDASLIDQFKQKIAEAEKLQSQAISKQAAHAKTRAQIKKAISHLSKSGKVALETKQSLRERLDDSEDLISNIEDIKPSTGSIFVRLFLGQVNVKAYASKDRILLRDEYDKFKNRTNWGFILFPIIWIINYVYLRHIWQYTHWIHTLTHIWLLYYYVSLSLRENILRVNGSTVRPWWIYHHYVSSVVAILVLTWPPDSKSWDFFLPTFTFYFLYQGLVQFFQARYQRARHYARRAMGKATHMDLSHTETLTEFHRGLYFIVLLVFISQAWQVYNGISLLNLLFVELNVSQPWYDFREEIQCGLIGILFIFLGVTNFIVTIQTLLDKSNRRNDRVRKLRRTRSDASIGGIGISASSISSNAASGGAVPTRSPVSTGSENVTPSLGISSTPSSRGDSVSDILSTPTVTTTATETSGGAAAAPATPSELWSQPIPQDSRSGIKSENSASFLTSINSGSTLNSMNMDTAVSSGVQANETVRKR